MDARRIRTQLLLTLDFEQTDSALIARAKHAIRLAPESDMLAAVEASRADRSTASAIRDTAIAGGLADEDVARLVGELASQGIM